MGSSFSPNQLYDIYWSYAKVKRANANTDINTVVLTLAKFWRAPLVVGLGDAVEPLELPVEEPEPLDDVGIAEIEVEAMSTPTEAGTVA